MIRVILVSANGTHVEVKTDAPYSPDLTDDLCSRARELMAETLRDQAHLVTDLDAA